MVEILSANPSANLNMSPSDSADDGSPIRADDQQAGSAISSCFSRMPLPELSPPPSPTLSSSLVVGKVYFLPHVNNVPRGSIVHAQKRQDGFFNHPVLVVDVDEKYAYFYSLTRKPPKAISETQMCFRLGTTTEDQGPKVLRLAKGFVPMTHETWVNLEQRYKIEIAYLRGWHVDCAIAESEFERIDRRIVELEADQNRYLYKPLQRDMSNMEPGTVLMLPNSPASSTFGAPILLVQNNYPEMTYFRIKKVSDNSCFDQPLEERGAAMRRQCLTIAQDHCFGHDGTPVMIVETGCQQMREPSYVEVWKTPRRGLLDECKTWCWPPIKIQSHSMSDLVKYIATLQGPPRNPPRLPQQLPQPQNFQSFQQQMRPPAYTYGYHQQGWGPMTASGYGYGYSGPGPMASYRGGYAGNGQVYSAQPNAAGYPYHQAHYQREEYPGGSSRYYYYYYYSQGR